MLTSTLAVAATVALLLVCAATARQLWRDATAPATGHHRAAATLPPMPNGPELPPVPAPAPEPELEYDPLDHRIPLEEVERRMAQDYLSDVAFGPKPLHIAELVAA